MPGRAATSLAAVAVAAAALAAAWQAPRVRHEAFFAWTRWERGHDPSPRTPEPGPARDVAAVPHYLHAAKPAPGHLANTERTLRAAAEVACAVEIDVGFSSDLVPFVSHDDDFGHHRGGPPDRLSAHTAAEVEAVRFTDGSGSMRLADFVRELLPRFDRVVIDVKGSQVRAEEKARALLVALGAAPDAAIQVIGRPGPVLLRMKRLRPGLPIGCESYSPAANHLAGFDLFSARATEVTRDADRKAREAGLYRLYWTAGSAEQLAEIQAWRPDGIIVDLADAGADALPPAWRRRGP